MERLLYGLALLFIGLIVKEFVNHNGRSKLHEKINSLDKKYVNREVCYTHVDALTKKVEASEKHLCDKIDDLKEFIKNGK